MAQVEPLFLAIEEGDAAAVHNLLANGASLDARIDLPEARSDFFRGLTPLMAAAQSSGQQTAIVELLLSHGADPFAVSEANVTALWYASGAGMWPKPFMTGDYAERLRSLLGAGLSANEIAPNGRSALGESCSVGDPIRTRLLLDAGAKPQPAGVTISKIENEEGRRDRESGPQYLESAPKRRLARFIGLEIRTGDRSNAFQIPLFQAAESGNAECVRELLGAGASVAQKDGVHRSALFYAATREIAEMLVEAGAYPDDRDFYYHTPLESAFRNRALDVAMALLQAAGDIDRRRKGWTYLQRAAFDDDAELVGALLGAGASCGATINDGATALHLASWHGDANGNEARSDESTRETIRLLVEAGADLEARDKQGRTPLHVAVSGDEGSVAATWALLRQGANANARDLDGRTPLMLAAEEGSADCVRVLIAAGADSDIRDRKLKRALDYAKGTFAGCRSLAKTARILRISAPGHTAGFVQDAEECVKLLSVDAKAG